MSLEEEGGLCNALLICWMTVVGDGATQLLHHCTSAEWVVSRWNRCVFWLNVMSAFIFGGGRRLEVLHYVCMNGRWGFSIAPRAHSCNHVRAALYYALTGMRVFLFRLVAVCWHRRWVHLKVVSSLSTPNSTVDYVLNPWKIGMSLLSSEVGFKRHRMCT